MPLKDHYKSPLILYVVWHQANLLGLKIAETLYNSFCRDTDSPLTRGLNIPIRFRYLSQDGKKTPLDIDTSLAERTAIVLLIDDEMFGDSNWYEYIQQLLDKGNDTTRIFPVALSEYAFSIDEARLSKKQFIDLKKPSSYNDESWAKKVLGDLKSRLLHDLSRFFFRIPQVSESESIIVEPPIKLCVSHAKVDGENLAIDFRDYVQSQTKLKTFFDVNDIADADDFEQSIKNCLKNAAIVVFLSDKYSTREWCRIEVLVAKRNKSPIVVVNNIDVGEKRSFPYLGNVPTLKYKNDCFGHIVDLALYQVLNNLFFEEKLKKEIEMYDISNKFKVYPIENAPELFNYIDIKRLQSEQDTKKILVLYPDPPLGTEELKVLNDIDQTIQFITPSLIHKTLKNGE